MSRQPLRKPNIEHHLFESVEDEVYALRWFLRYHWYLVALLLLGFGLFVYLISPLPPRTVTLAAGEPHSSQDDLGQHYRAFFVGHGVELRLVRTNGPVANVGMLAGGEVDAAFAIGGLPVPADRGIVSPGSVEFEPVWLFYRGEPGLGDDPFAAFASRTLSITTTRTRTSTATMASPTSSTTTSGRATCRPTTSNTTRSRSSGRSLSGSPAFSTARGC